MFGKFADTNYVGSLAPIATVMLPEALKMQLWLYGNI